MIDIVRGTGLGFSAVQWGIWKHEKNTKLVIRVKRQFRISEKFIDVAKKIKPDFEQTK